MTPSLTDTLCTRCGLCCDGSLLADVELSGRAEATRLEVMGLEVEDDGANGMVLVLPCGALKGRLCGIYPHRPRCCRTFECALLQDARRGAIGVERAQEKIAEALVRRARVRELLARLGRRDARLPLAERVAEALPDDIPVPTDKNVTRDRAELKAAMSALRRLIEATFLRGMLEGS
jgi:hypothetical protein